MRTISGALIAGLAVIALSSPAHAAERRVPVDEGGDVQRCVTYAEYTAADDAYVRGDVTRGQVRRIFDTDGHRINSSIMDAMAGQVYVTPGQEVAVPKHRAVRFYLGCVTADDPYGSDVYVEFNVRTGRMVASLWI